MRRLLRLTPNSKSRHAEADEELETLVASRIDDLVARGMSPDQARAEAIRRLGASLDEAREQVHRSTDRRERRMRLREYLEDLLADLRYAARGLTHRPGFTAIIVLTLAVGIGATTAIFSAVNVLLLRPLPFPKPHELMALNIVPPRFGIFHGSDHMVWSYPKLAEFKKRQTVFSDVSLYEEQQYLYRADGVELIRGEAVGATYLHTLGVRVVRGRDFDPSIDAQPGAPRQAIISYSFWQDRFGGDAGVIGRAIPLDAASARGGPMTVIGVAEPGFNGMTGKAEVFAPVTIRSAADLSEPQSHEFSAVARRKPGVSEAVAQLATETLGKQLGEIFVDDYTKGKAWSAKAWPLDGERVAPLIRRAILVLFGAVTFVLLIACVNVANLLIGRATTRRREIAVRLAIGAGRGRLLRLLLAESSLLAAMGGVSSVGVTWIGTRALSAVNPAAALRTDQIGGLGAVSLSAVDVDWRTLVFTLALSLTVGLLFGLVPALTATRDSLAETLKSGARANGTRFGGLSVRRSLVILEVALAVVLLAGSGLMIRSLGKLISADMGFDGKNVLMLRMTTLPGIVPRDSMPGFLEQLSARLAAIPGVTKVGMADCAPLSNGCSRTLATTKDGVALDRANGQMLGIHWANEAWFPAMGVPLRAGRHFDAGDVPTSTRVTVINETAARKLFPNQNPIGHRVGLGMANLADGALIVGVVGDVRQSPDSAAEAEAFVPLRQSPRPRVRIFLKTAVDPLTVIPAVRAAMHEMAPGYPVDQIGTMEDQARTAMAQTRFGAVLLGLFALTALSLAVVGVYGVMSLVVGARTREIGIRIALGADQSKVQRLVVREGMALVAVGAAIGTGGALLCTRLLSSMLFELSPSDPATYATIILLLMTAAAMASWLPARRAARVDPVTALRTE